jgi:membrane protein DedA with SNARE-associated domain
MFGAFLCFSASYHLVSAYLATTVGSLAGGMVVYEAGAWMGRHREGWPRFLRGPRTERAIGRVLGLFERHGGALMAINRFWPALRAVFFLAAGMARRPRAEVALYGGLSSAAWHGLIFVIGWQAGERFDAVVDFFEKYTLFAWIAVGVLVLAWAGHAAWRRARARSD